MKKIIFKKLFVIKLILLLFFSYTFTASAATLSVEISNPDAKIGDVITATLYVNAEGESINNVEGLLRVSSDVLEIQSISILGSNLSLWVEQPNHSKDSVTFNGGVPNPGYLGSRGKVVTVFMKALKEGTASINFQSASVRANDGFGTDVLNSKTGAVVSVNSTAIVPPEAKPIVPKIIDESSDVPKLPVIKSMQADDSTKWYNSKDISFNWDLPTDVVSVRTLLDENSNSNPTISYSPAINSKTIKDLEDGIWYFHLSYKNSVGWSGTSHKKVMIDTTPPTDTIIDYEIIDSGLVKINLDGDDILSSIEKFVLSTSGKENIEITNIDSDGKASFIFPDSFSGLKELRVEAFDGANNVNTSFIEIEFPTITSPVITGEKEKIATEKSLLDVTLWGENLVKILSIVVPATAMIILLIIFVHFVINKLIVENKKYNRLKKIKKITKETVFMINALRDDILEDIQLFKIDNKTKNIEELEKALLNNLLQDLKTMEKVVSKKINRIRPKKSIKPDEDK